MTSTLSNPVALLDAAKWAFTTRRVPRADAVALAPDTCAAVRGDLILCEVVSLGQHRKVQMASRRASELYLGDRIVVAVGDRYAPDQFLASATLAGTHAHLVAGGGVVGRVEAAHEAMQAPTLLRPVGRLLTAAGRPVNVADYALPALPMDHGPTVIGVFGASMNAGKTTATAALALGLRRAGLATMAVKATGTGAFGDYHTFEDTGVEALDFTDVGMTTTYRMPMARIEAGFATLIATCAARGAEVVVCEIADGVFQPETRAILAGSSIRDRMDGIVFATGDALSAFGAVQVLNRVGLGALAITGLVSRSPLARAEAEEATGVPIYAREQLADPDIARSLVAPVLRHGLRPCAA